MTTRPENPAPAGFTLVELSIVLVVIGLLAGGVLVGRDLIHAAEVRTQVSQVGQINTAVNTYRLKFGCLPGDCPTASRFFPATAQPERVTDGPGVGLIAGYAGTSYLGGQVVDLSSGWVFQTQFSWVSVFDHLAAAGVWAAPQYDETTVASNRPGVAFPALKLVSGGAGPLFSTFWNNAQGGVAVGWEPAYSYVPAGHKIRLGGCQVNPGYWAADAFGFQCGLNPPDAAAIDGKVDDGRPFSGRAVITTQEYIYRVPGGAMNELYGYCDTGGATDADRIANARYRSEGNLDSYGGQPVGRYCALSITATF